MTSPTGSPPSSRRFSIVRSAPISRRVSNRPARSGLSSTPSTVTAEPGVIRAATSGKAADDGSPGTRDDGSAQPLAAARRITRAPGSSATTTSAPKARSMRSV